MTDKRKNDSKTSKAVTRIYLGPNIQGGRLLKSTVFRGDIPEHLKPLLLDKPEINELIVPLDDMIRVQQRIQQKGTAEYVAYQQIAKGVVENGV